MSDQLARLPEYACAIITRLDGWLLLQLRPPGARHAPAQLTCFGGAREQGENEYACLTRELKEELGWTPPHLEAACDLRCGSRLIARFFRCQMPQGVTVCTEPDQVAVWAPTSALAGLPLSPWHRAVLAAVAGGVMVVDLPV